MTRFCEASGHKINLAKSKAFFSRSIHFNSARELSHELGIKITRDLGIYLGIPLMHKRATKVTFSPLIHKAQQQLASWKCMFLSMAGQIVLIKYVFSAIPRYQMQTMLLPYGVLNDLERVSRNFLWNHEQDRRKMHLIFWDIIRQDKSRGGLGIRDLIR